LLNLFGEERSLEKPERKEPNKPRGKRVGLRRLATPWSKIQKKGPKGKKVRESRFRKHVPSSKKSPKNYTKEAGKSVAPEGHVSHLRKNSGEKRAKKTYYVTGAFAGKSHEGKKGLGGKKSSEKREWKELY